MFIFKSFIWIILAVAALGVPKHPNQVVAPPKDPSSHSKHFDQHHNHNAEYDHEQFLGNDQAKTFDQLEPQESRRRLGIIVDKIDINKDGLVDLLELKAWIKFSQRRYIDEDVERQWLQHNPENNSTIPWETYRQSVYGFMDEMDPNELDKQDNGMSYKSLLTRDRRRWSVADQNNDDELTREEFTSFLHPEDRAHMRDVVLSETLEDIDKDNDGKVSAEEYIGDMYKNDDDEEEPDWVLNEREVFLQYRDKNHDGFLDREEVRQWITPIDFDNSEAEAKHLIFEADSDSDEQLSKEEIMEKYDLFVGSQATDYGEALSRHDEF